MADDKVSKQFREHSIAEFFKKNRQMLGFTGKVRSLTTIIHELVTNGIDACEEAGILPDIEVKLEEMGPDHYKVIVQDNGPGIPKKHLGKALGMMLAGTKFHRYIQQRGQQGIGAAGCTMYSVLTTGQPIHAVSGHDGKRISCNIGIDFKTNKPVITNLVEEESDFRGLIYEGEFKDVKHENSVRGVLEYLRRTALANPHVNIKFSDPKDSITFPRAVDVNPARPKEIKPHPLGISAHDLLEMAVHQKENRTISAFLQNTFSRMSLNKVNELREMLPDIDFNKKPNSLVWNQAENLVKAFQNVKWIAPSMDAVIPIGEGQVEKSFTNIFNPEYVMITERSPRVYRGGIPFVVEVGMGYGGGIVDSGKRGELMRFANRVPLLFDGSGCAITEAVKSIDWKRYGLKNLEEEPIVILVNLSSVYVPYTSAGKQAISDEEDIVEEIRNAIMESSRGMSRYLSGKRKAKEIETKRKVVSRYIIQLSEDLSDLAGKKSKAKELRKNLEDIVERKYERKGEKDE